MQSDRAGSEAKAAVVDRLAGGGGARLALGGIHRRGKGPSDTVPADAGVSSEIPDPTHPAFAGSEQSTTIAGLIQLAQVITAPIPRASLPRKTPLNRGVAYGVDRLVNGDPAISSSAFTSRTETRLLLMPRKYINTSFGSSQTDDNEGDGDDVTTAFFGVPARHFPRATRTSDGSPTVQNTGRNTMSVGAFNDVGTVASADDVVLGISSRGPTPAGRKKPDLTAPGGAVVAAELLLELIRPSNPDYTGNDRDLLLLSPRRRCDDAARGIRDHRPDGATGAADQQRPGLEWHQHRPTRLDLRNADRVAARRWAGASST